MIGDDEDEIGAYQLSLNEIEPPSYPDDLEIPPYFINALASGSPESVLWDKDITYYFSDGTDNINNNSKEFVQSQKDSVADAMQAWQQVADLSFSLVTNIDEADIVYYRDSSPGEVEADAYAYYYGNVHIDVNLDINYVPGEHNHVLIHESGYALGLDHPFQYEGRDIYRSPLPYEEDSTKYTYMSYNVDYGPNYNQPLISGPEIFDIAAVHYLYGVNKSINTKNNTYGMHDRYIADARGIDTLDASNETDQVFISLEESSWNYIGFKSNSILDENQSFIGYDSWIENANGEIEADHLQGNHLSNILNGNDIVDSNEGSDFLNGGVGAETMIGGAGNDIYYVDHAGDRLIEKAAEGHDTIKSSINLNLNFKDINHVEDLTLIGGENT